VAAKKAARVEPLLVAVLQRTPPSPPTPVQYLMVKRPSTGLLAGQWEFPTVPVEGEAAHEALRVKVGTVVKATRTEAFAWQVGPSGVAEIHRSVVGVRVCSCVGLDW
jgi:adenine-specific DNA glycosylase